jgi:large subunit ribosomal protein L21
MYGYAEIKGQQFRIVPGEVLKVPLIDAEIGTTIEIKPLLSYIEENSTKFGIQSGEMTAKATILEHGRDDKVVVFKKRRRHGYKKRRNHRQYYTMIRIEEIMKG